jgi:hypothetical protein
MEAEAIGILCDELLLSIQTATNDPGSASPIPAAAAMSEAPGCPIPSDQRSGCVPYSSESPMDTTSVYLARRFCTGCCREWGDMELLLDLRARRLGKTRGEVLLDLSATGAVTYGLCCRRAIFPVQHNIGSYTKDAACIISSSLGAGVPSCLALTFARPRPTVSWIARTEGALPLRGPITEEAIDAMFA